MIKELDVIQLHELQAEQINVITMSFKILTAHKSEFIDEHAIVEKFIPKLTIHTQNEMYRYNMGDIVTMLEGYNALWDAGVIKTKQLGYIHKTCHDFMHQYLHKAKKSISGAQFAALV